MTCRKRYILLLAAGLLEVFTSVFSDWARRVAAPVGGPGAAPVAAPYTPLPPPAQHDP
jgi:hypothetical protein